ncbi:MAG TPA: SDR family NAD(P)-dependent oxidoreductase [Acidimicrobiales bacterium]|nr:SDR family NAD(P)-dependent oxidoreductase [Acidimicrobiales bacterium]
MVELKGHRILVIGASSGIGREVAIQCAAAGADVAFAARRVERLEEAAAGAGGRSFAFPCDVREPGAAEAAVESTAARFGGLDAVVYATGVSPLAKMADADLELWRNLIDTNLIGAAMVAKSSLPHLYESQGRLLFLGSSSVGRPYPGLVPYCTTKAALHEMARGLRNECPWLRVTTFIVGPTITEFANEWDMELAIEMGTRWNKEGYPAGAAMPAEEMAAQVVAVLASGARVNEILVMPDEAAAEGTSAL